MMSNEKDAKLKALELTLDKLDKAYGKGTVMKMGDNIVENVEVISSGSLGLDYALGVGGYPRGRVVEIYGPESSGKTTLTLHAIAECQKAGGIAAFIDAEHAFDRYYAKNLGVNIDDLIISQPDHGEQALEIADNLIRSGAIDIVVVDSVAALTPKSEIEGEMGDSKMGLHARLMSQALRRLTSTISKTNCTVFFINQLREKIGIDSEEIKISEKISDVNELVEFLKKSSEKHSIAFQNIKSIKVAVNKEFANFNTKIERHKKLGAQEPTHAQRVRKR